MPRARADFTPLRFGARQAPPDSGRINILGS
jgi:hypothetical protein